MPPELVYQLDGQWKQFPLDRDEIRVGRDPQSDLVIDHRSVSRSHATLFRRGDTWRVRDEGSRYGTRINHLEHADKPLVSGDKIYLHKFPLTFMDGPVVAVTLTPRADEDGEPSATYHDTVDFTSLVTRPPDVERLRKLLTVVTEASRAILVSKSLDETFERVLDLVFAHLPVQRGFVMLWDAERQDLVTRCTRFESQGTDRKAPIRFSRTIAEKVYRDKVSVITTDAQTDGRFADGASIMELGIRSAMAAPLWHGEQVDGLIYADTLQARAFDSFDLDLLSALGNHLAVAIEQSRLQRSVIEQQLVRRRLERYHSPAVVERIAAVSGDGEPERLLVDERDVTVLFADIVGFTRRCEGLEPRAIAELLNRYFSEMTEVIFRHEGTLDKFIGDCLMAVFGAPLATADHPRRAVDAALDMREALRGLNDPLPEAERVEFRVGIHSGTVVAGDIGSVLRSDFTVLGSTVNLAARLESAVAQAGQIVVSDETLRRLGGRYLTRLLGEHRPKGVSTPLRCHEVVASRG